MVERRTLPSSLLFEGKRGIGKQRLALWLAQLLVCERGENDRPCGNCLACRSVLELRHPDVYWFRPRPSLRDTSAMPEDVLEDFAEANVERVVRHGLYERGSGSDAIFLVTVRTLVQKAAIAPGMGSRKVFIVGDAERMVAQEGSDQAANAFLKLLEEPPADTTVILTSSEPGALLPTVQSRVVRMRCSPLGDDDVLAFVRDPVVKTALDSLHLPRGDAERVAMANGAPGDLLSAESLASARAAAVRLLHAASAGGAERYSAALAQGSSRSRGAFADTLAQLNVLLAERAAAAVARGDTTGAYAASRAVAAVCDAQTRADGNVNPQLLTARLMGSLAEIPHD